MHSTLVSNSEVSLTVGRFSVATDRQLHKHFSLREILGDVSA
jgi:hypothetical protein